MKWLDERDRVEAPSQWFSSEGVSSPQTTATGGLACNMVMHSSAKPPPCWITCAGDYGLHSVWPAMVWHLQLQLQLQLLLLLLRLRPRLLLRYSRSPHLADVARSTALNCSSRRPRPSNPPLVELLIPSGHRSNREFDFKPRSLPNKEP